MKNSTNGASEAPDIDDNAGDCRTTGISAVDVPPRRMPASTSPCILTTIVSANAAALTSSSRSSERSTAHGTQAPTTVPSSQVVMTSEQMRLISVSGPPSQYVKLNVGGCLHFSTIATLVKQDSMLRAMFSGRLEVLTDSEGWVLIDRCGKHFPVILNFLRDGAVALPESRREILEILTEARYYCIQNLIDLCQAWLELNQKQESTLTVCKIPIITSAKEEKALLQSTSRPTIKLLLNRHNNKYSYTSQSDDNLLKNLELFDKLIVRFNERVLFIKDVGAANEVCSWTFYGHGRKVTEVCCTSIVYATDKKHTKVEFPEARIYEEAMNILLYEPDLMCPSCMSLNWQNADHAHYQATTPPPSHPGYNHCHDQQHDVHCPTVAPVEETTVPSTSGYLSDREYRDPRSKITTRAAEV